MTATITDANANETSDPTVDIDAANDADQSEKTSAKTSGSSAVRARTGVYRSGFCGSTSVNGVSIPNPQTLHRMCSLGATLCTCECHGGVEVWEGREQLFADAAAGRINEARERANKRSKRKK